MDNKTFYILFSEAIEDADRDAFVSDWALSSVFPEDSDPGENAEICGKIWDAAHLSVKEMRERAGMTQAQFAERFCIPKRTIENWEGGSRTPPDYVRLMMARELGMVYPIPKTIGDYMKQHHDANMGYCVPYQSKNKRVAFCLLDVEIQRLRIDGDNYDQGDAFSTESIFNLDDDDTELFRRAVIAADKSLKETARDKRNIMTALMFACKPCGCVNCPSFPCEEMEKNASDLC